MTTMKQRNKSFAQKLLARKHEDSPIGDLAQDANNDEYLPRSGSVDQVAAHLRRNGACYAAMEAFREFCRCVGEREKQKAYRWSTAPGWSWTTIRHVARCSVCGEAVRGRCLYARSGAVAHGRCRAAPEPLSAGDA